MAGLSGGGARTSRNTKKVRSGLVETLDSFRQTITKPTQRVGSAFGDLLMNQFKDKGVQAKRERPPK